MKILIAGSLLFALAVACVKSKGKNPVLAYSDDALLDSCKIEHQYYKNDPTTLHSGKHGPHGNFKLRFNALAMKALTDSGKLPSGSKMPDGSLVIKDVYSGTNVSLYAFMYKRSGSWLWGEVKPDGEALYSVNKDPGTCTSCHSQSGNRDLIVSFNFY